MKCCFKEVALAGVFRIEKFEQLHDETLVDVFFRDCRLEIRRFQKSKKKFVNQLKI